MNAAWPTADETALGDLRADWGAIYAIEATAGGYEAAYRFEDAPVPLTAPDPEGLESALRADWSRRWRVRTPAPGELGNVVPGGAR